MKQRVLVVEDSPVVVKILHHILKDNDAIEPVYVESFAAARTCLDQAQSPFFAALVDLNLPDAPHGDVVDFALHKGVPTIVLTGSFDEDKRKNLLAKGVVDYITKEGRYSYEYAAKLLSRLIKNQHLHVLVVDDSRVGRRSVINLLRLHQYQVFEAEDGMQGIKVLLANPSIKLIITDFNMPLMDGCAMVQAIRGKYEKSDLGIIGLSSDGEETLSARFIKSGADDFLRKPFNQEEFFCRVTHSIETLEMVETIRDIANRDPLTGVYNRQYFFSRGEALLRQAQEGDVPITAAVIDLDGFREVNDQYGHEAADYVMKYVANKLMDFFDRFLFARADGTTFYVLLLGLSSDKAQALIEKVRQLISAINIDYEGHSIGIGFSGGVSGRHHNDVLDGLIKNAEICFHRAKDAGGELVVCDD